MQEVLGRMIQSLLWVGAAAMVAVITAGVVALVAYIRTFERDYCQRPGCRGFYRRQRDQERHGTRMRVYLCNECDDEITFPAADPAA